MKYKFLDLKLSLDERRQLNEAILTICQVGKTEGIDKDEIYSAYTGKGKLHDVDYSLYQSYRDYAQAKQELEAGQFFTPHEIAAVMVEALNVSNAETVADLTCGHGVFFNFLPTESNCYGCEIDKSAATVAKYLYPESNIHVGDLANYQPIVRFDYVVGNPPFNISIRGESSQFFFLRKALELLKPGGILMAIVPQTFLEDELYYKKYIELLNSQSSFVCQSKLPETVFKMYEVRFKTKIVVFQKFHEKIEAIAYQNNYIPICDLKWTLKPILQKRKEHYASLFLELHKEKSNSSFQYRFAKLLYQIKCHAATKGKYADVMSFYQRHMDQEKPETMDWKEWDKVKITENKVLAYAKKILKKQHETPIDKVRIVRNKHEFYFKGYSDKSRRLLPDVKLKIHEVSQHPEIYLKALKSKAVKRQLKALELLNTKTEAIQMDYLDSFQFDSFLQSNCRLTELQKHDLSIALQRPYYILNWQQGSGKTPAALAWALYQPLNHVLVVSAALAINLTWKPFLTLNKVPFAHISHLSDLKKIKPGDFLLISTDAIIKLKKHMQKFVKLQSNKISLIFDESDEITNHNAKRTAAILAVCRRLKRKLLTTGTTTRNNINELYSQLELIYNNSGAWICDCPTTFVEDKKEGQIIERENRKHFEKPFPAYYGCGLFRSCYNPAKATVFGIEKLNQDVYNRESLQKLIERTITTRKFKEIAGDGKYAISSIEVVQNKNEEEVYERIINDLHSMIPLYFQNTGNTRKEAALRIIRQIQLLIKATSIPQHFNEYGTDEWPNKAKTIHGLVEKRDELVCVGVTTVEALIFYTQILTNLGRPIFQIQGNVDFSDRKSIIVEFENSKNGILVTTQQSLKSSVSIPSCNYVIVESLQWNIPKIEQFFFRFIRFDCTEKTEVVFVNYKNTIEMNIKALLLAKEKLNEFIKTLSFREDAEIYEEYGADLEILDSLLRKDYDEDGRSFIAWGRQNVV